MMTHPLLLPEGLRDRLPAEAEAASRVMRALLDVMRSHGYARVTPPMAEFLDTLVHEATATSEHELLRLTDPVSGRTMAIRPDITQQIGRIATSRLAQAARPLRLSYAGQVMKLTANELWPERERLQVGAELIGSDGAAAASEVVRLAIEALHAAGAEDIIVDFALPLCVDRLAEAHRSLDAVNLGQVEMALDAKDAGALVALGADVFVPLLAATGPFASAVAKLREVDQRGTLNDWLDSLETIAASLSGMATLTLDPTERHGFEYQSWFGFSIFVAGHNVVVGRGGGYSVRHACGNREAAVGFSLYPDPLIEAGLGNPDLPERRLFLPIGHDAAQAVALRAEGWVTIAALSDADDGAALGCTHHLTGGEPAAY